MQQAFLAAHMESLEVKHDISRKGTKRFADPSNTFEAQKYIKVTDSAQKYSSSWNRKYLGVYAERDSSSEDEEPPKVKKGISGILNRLEKPRPKESQIDTDQHECAAVPTSPEKGTNTQQDIQVDAETSSPTEEVHRNIQDENECAAMPTSPEKASTSVIKTTTTEANESKTQSAGTNADEQASEALPTADSADSAQKGSEDVEMENAEEAQGLSFEDFCRKQKEVEYATQQESVNQKIFNTAMHDGKTTSQKARILAIKLNLPEEQRARLEEIQDGDSIGLPSWESHIPSKCQCLVRPKRCTDCIFVYSMQIKKICSGLDVPTQIPIAPTPPTTKITANARILDTAAAIAAGKAVNIAEKSIFST